jgi:hypothetical protein
MPAGADLAFPQSDFRLPVGRQQRPDLLDRDLVDGAVTFRQTYRTVKITETGAVINYKDAHRDADIVVDTDGLPVTYPDVANRL